MPRSTVALLLVLAVAPLGGCTAGMAVGRIVTAQKAVRDAEAKGAAELAPYEHQLAVLHLREAWEEHGDGEFKTCSTYADLAKAWADKAGQRIEGGGRGLGELRSDVESLEDVLEGRDDASDEATTPDATPTPRPERKKEEPADDFLDEGEDDEIELEEDAPPPPPPPPPPKKNEPKTDPSSPWGKRP